MATTEQFSLRWNNFHSNLTTSFHELLEGADMVDVTLAVDGHFLQAHKIVLSICSPYFKQMFKANPCKHPIVILKDVCHDNMKDILEFMYMGEVNVLRENLSQFLRTAELLQVKGLTGDDSSDTSSRKDEKIDSLCDNDEDADIMQFNHVIDSDVEVPPRYGKTPERTATPSPVQHQQQHTIPTQQHPATNQQHQVTNQHLTSSQHSSAKRQSKSLLAAATTKKSKPDVSSNSNKSIKQNTEQENGNGVMKKFDDEFIDANLKMESRKGEQLHIDFDEPKEGTKTTSDVGKDNSIGNSSSTEGAGDQDVLMYSVDSKGHVYCPYCFRKFVNRYNLKVHIRDKHVDTKIDLDCAICGKTMRNKSCLRVHMYHHRKQQLESGLPE